MNWFDTATGRLHVLLPPGPERDELLGLVRIGVKFRDQQRGKRAGFLRQYLVNVIAGMDQAPTFDNVIVELETAAARRSLRDEAGNPIMSVNRIWSVVTYQHPKKGAQEVTFKTIRNLIAHCRKK